MNQKRITGGSARLTLAAAVCLLAGGITAGCAEMEERFKGEVAETRDAFKDTADARKASAEKSVDDAINKPGDMAQDKIDEADRRMEEETNRIEGEVDETVDEMMGNTDKPADG